MGIALGTATVTVNNQSSYRKVEYFRKELTVDNSSVPLWAEVEVAATDEDAVNGHTFVPKTPEQYAYDTDGNLTSDGRWDYTWDAENRLVKMESRTDAPTGSKLRLEFAYDSQDRRIWKKVTSLDTGGGVLSEQKFLYDGWNLIAEAGTSGSVGEFLLLFKVKKDDHERKM